MLVKNLYNVNLVLNTTNNPEEEMKKIKNNNKESILLNESDNILRDKYNKQIYELCKAVYFLYFSNIYI